MNKEKIIRVRKDTQNPYVMINKNFLSDPNTSWKAKGILTYLLSKPDNWELRVNDLINHSTDGRDSVYSGINELIKYGYIERIPIREKGKFIHLEYLIHETPVSPKAPDNGGLEPDTENPDMADTDMGNPDINNNYINNNYINNKSVSHKPTDNLHQDNQEGNDQNQTARPPDPDYQSIISGIDLSALENGYSDLVKDCTLDLFYNGLDNIPPEFVRNKLHRIDAGILMNMAIRFDAAKPNIEPRNYYKYFKKIFWNTLIEMSAVSAFYEQ